MWRFVFVLMLFSALARAQINPGHGGAWFNPQTPGQGILIEVIESGPLLFIAWFTYVPEDEGKLGAAEHRWLTGQGEYLDGRAELPLFNTRGGVFDAPSETVTEPVGTAVLEFFDCRSGTFSYQLDEDELSGSFDLVRISDGAVCDQLK